MENKTKNGRSKEGNINRANAINSPFSSPNGSQNNSNIQKRIKREIRNCYIQRVCVLVSGVYSTKVLITSRNVIYACGGISVFFPLFFEFLSLVIMYV
jgi:hypothetical protein